MVSNEVYINTLVVSGMLDNDLVNEHPDVIESIKNTKISLKRFLDIYFKYKLGVFPTSYIYLCKRLGELLDKDDDKERNIKFLNKLCDVLELRAQVLSARIFSKLTLLQISHVIDSGSVETMNSGDVDYENMYKYLSFMKLCRLNSNVTLKNIDNDTYILDRGHRESTDLEGEFDLKDTKGNLRYRFISMVILKKDSVNYIPSAAVKTKGMKEDMLRKYIEDDNVTMVIFYNSITDESMMENITGDYMTVDI